MSLIEELKQKKVNINQIISLAILIVACLIAINLFIRQNKKIAQMLQIKNEEIEKKEVLLRIEDLNKKIVLYRENLRPKENREIINTITNLARDTGVEVTALRPRELRVPGQRAKRVIYDKIFFHLSIKVDSYIQLSKFINNLEKSAMIFVIDSLKIKRLVVADLLSKPERIEVDLVIGKLFM